MASTNAPRSLIRLWIVMPSRTNILLRRRSSSVNNGSRLSAIPLIKSVKACIKGGARRPIIDMISVAKTMMPSTISGANTTRASMIAPNIAKHAIYMLAFAMPIISRILSIARVMPSIALLTYSGILSPNS